MVEFRISVDDDEWQRWKRTVPREKSLHDRIVELLEADADGRVASPLDPTPTSAATDDGPTPAVEYESRPDSVADVLERAREDFSDDSEDRQQARLDSLQAAVEAVVEQPLSKSEIENRIYDGEVRGQNAETWFRKTVRPYLKEVAEYDNADRKWHWTG